jgi:hypothetical protein
MAILNRIVIQMDDAGTGILGISRQDRDGKPMPLTGTAFAALFPGLNAAALDTIDAKNNELSVALSAHDQIESLLADAAPEDAKAAAILEKVREGKQSANDKELQAALARKAEIEALIDKLSGGK